MLWRLTPASVKYVHFQIQIQNSDSEYFNSQGEIVEIFEYRHVFIYSAVIGFTSPFNFTSMAFNSILSLGQNVHSETVVFHTNIYYSYS